MKALFRSIPWGTVALIFGSLFMLMPLALVDYEWTLWLHEHQLKWLGEFMRRTVFEGDAFGASDPSILLQLLAFSGYLSYHPLKSKGWFQRYRPYLGFFVFNAFVTGLGLVHSLKWIIGRARPYLVLKGELPYSDWFEFGPHFITEGIFYGSFPSGHTAAVFLLIMLCYALLTDPVFSWKARLIGILWGAVVLTYTGLMILGRSMTLHHWLSDSIGIVCLCWIGIHVIFFFVLKIPRQVAYVRRWGHYPPLPRFWEFQLLWRLFLITLGVMATIIGIRSVLLARSIWLLGPAILGVPLAVILVRSLNRVYQTAMSSLVQEKAE